MRMAARPPASRWRWFHILLGLSAALAPAVARAQSADTLIVFGPNQYVRLAGGTSTVYTESFSATPTAGRRFVLEIVNATTDPKLKLSKLTVGINGLEVVGSAEFKAGTALAKEVALAASNSAQFALTADVGVRITARIVSVPDPTFAAFGPESFSCNTVIQSRSFALPASGAAPFWLSFVNGAGDPARRVDDAHVWLNGVEVIGKADVSLGIASVSRQVTLLSQNTLEVRLDCKSNQVAILEITATDVVSPLLTITSPAERLLTALTSVTAAGAVQDVTAVHVVVNGVSLAVGEGGSFSGSIPLPAEGANLLQF